MALLVADQRIFDSSDGAYTSIAKLAENYYAVLYRGAGNDGFVRTIKVWTTSNQITASAAYEFSAYDYYGGKLITVSGSVRAIIRAGATEVWLYTINITDGGVITHSLIDSAPIATATLTNKYPDILHIDGTVYLMGYTGAGTDGFLQTINIAASGTIGAVISTYEFDLSNADQPPVICHIAGTTYAVIYRNGVTGVTTLFTVDVAADGTITGEMIDTLVLEAADRTNTHGIVNIAGGTKYAIVYENYDDSNVTLVTVDIAADGTIGDAVADSTTIADAEDPKIIYYDTGKYLVLYKLTTSLMAKIYNLAVDGTIGAIDETKALAGPGDRCDIANRTGKEFITVSGSSSVGRMAYIGVAPTLTTQAVTAILPSTATGNGNVTGLGEPNPEHHGHCWNTTGTPTYGDSAVDNGAVSAPGAFTSAMTGLIAGTLYYVRAYTRTGDTATYGDEVSFRAAPAIVGGLNPALVELLAGD